MPFARRAFTDSVDLIDEHDGRCMLICYSEKFAHELRAVAQVSARDRMASAISAKCVRAEMPTYFWMSSDPTTRKKVADV